MVSDENSLHGLCQVCFCTPLPMNMKMGYIWEREIEMDREIYRERFSQKTVSEENE